MVSSRKPGPVGLDQDIPDLNDGTLVRALSPLPGVVGIDGPLSLRPAAESMPTTSPAGAPGQIAEDRVIRSLQGKSKHLSVGRDVFRIVPAAEWPDFRNDERYEIVAKEEALLVIQELAALPSTSPADKAAFQEATSLLADTYGRLTDTGLLLLRTHRARFIKSANAEPPVTPSQLARMMGKDEQKEEHWIEIEVLYEDGTCVAGAKYLIVTPDKEEKTGVTNAYGRARVDGIIVAGQCKISFPDIDGSTWSKA